VAGESRTYDDKRRMASEELTVTRRRRPHAKPIDSSATIGRPLPWHAREKPVEGSAADRRLLPTSLFN
jgi:hypothetical protein